MIWVLALLGIAALAGSGMAGALAVRSRRDYDARGQVVPGVASGAPRSWAGAHTPEARLHRRLGDAVRGMRAQPALGGAAFADQRAALEQEALRIDARLVAAAALTGERRTPAIDAVASLVERYEQAAADLVAASLGEEGSLDAVVAASELRLRALAEARAEVERVDEQQQRGGTSTG